MATNTSNAFDLSALFGGKSWYKSLTAWGLVIFLVGEQFVEAAGAQGILAADLATTLSGYMDSIGYVLGILGIRRRL